MSAAADETASPTALARRLVAEGKRGEAERVVAGADCGKLRFAVRACAITATGAAELLNGTVEAEDGRFSS